MWGLCGLPDRCTVDEPVGPGWRLADGSRPLCFRGLPVGSGSRRRRRGTAAVERRATVRDVLRAAAVEYNTVGEVDDPVMPSSRTWGVCCRFCAG